METATTMFHYAWLLADMRRTRDERLPNGMEPEDLFREVLQIRFEQLGPQHRDTAVAMTGLLAVVAGSGRENEVKELLVPALQIYQAQPGGDQIGMAVSLFITGGMARRSGNLDKATADYEKAIEIGRKVLGDRHPLLAICLGELAGTYKQAGRFEEAEKSVLEALDIAHEVAPRGHPQMIPALVELAAWRYQHDQLAACEALDLEAIRIAKNFPVGHEAKTCEALQRQAYACYARGDFEKAKTFYQDVINIGIPAGCNGFWAWHLEAELGIAQTLRAQQKFGDAEQRYSQRYRQLVGQRQNYPDEPTEHWKRVYAACEAGLGGALIDQSGGIATQSSNESRRDEEIKELLAKSATYREIRMIGDEVVIGENLLESARFELIQGNIGQATDDAWRSIELLERFVPQDSWLLAGAETTYAACLIERGEFEQSEKLLVEAIPRLQSVLGADHLRTIEAQQQLVKLEMAWSK